MSVAHQASCVAIDGRAILIEGAPGSGKSSLALALIDRGAVLVGDDGVMLEVVDGRLLASPHPNVVGLLEVRNLGLITYPVDEQIPVALVVSLDPEAPRFIEDAATVERAGITVPLVRVWPDSPVLALRVELALARFAAS